MTKRTVLKTVKTAELPGTQSSIFKSFLVDAAAMLSKKQLLVIHNKYTEALTASPKGTIKDNLRRFVGELATIVDLRNDDNVTVTPVTEAKSFKIKPKAVTKARPAEKIVAPVIEEVADVFDGAGSLTVDNGTTITADVPSAIEVIQSFSSFEELPTVPNDKPARKKREATVKNTLFSVSPAPAAGAAPGTRLALQAAAVGDTPEDIVEDVNTTLVKMNDEERYFRTCFEKLGAVQLEAFSALRASDVEDSGYIKLIRISTADGKKSRLVVVVGTGTYKVKDKKYNLVASLNGNHITRLPWDAMLQDLHNKGCMYKTVDTKDTNRYIRLFPYIENTRIEFSYYGLGETRKAGYKEAVKYILRNNQIVRS